MGTFIDPTTPEGLERLRKINPELAASFEKSFEIAAKKLADQIDEDMLAIVRSGAVK